MKILLSAYSCAPNRGSEPGIGWSTALELTHDHEVWVVVNARHREEIEAELAIRPVESLHVVYFDLLWPFSMINKDGPLLQLHYYLWQYGVFPTFKRLHGEHSFDVSMHVTFGRYWSPSLLSLLPVPFVWSSVGGGETLNKSMRSTLSPWDACQEYIKDWVFCLGLREPMTRITAKRSAYILANSLATTDKVRPYANCEMGLLDTTVVDRKTVEYIGTQLDFQSEQRPLRFTTMTRLAAWKGVHLGIAAFAKLDHPTAEYLILGEGKDRANIEALARDLGVSDRVHFLGEQSLT